MSQERPDMRYAPALSWKVESHAYIAELLGEYDMRVHSRL